MGLISALPHNDTPYDTSAIRSAFTGRGGNSTLMNSTNCNENDLTNVKAVAHTSTVSCTAGATISKSEGTKQHKRRRQ